MGKLSQIWLLFTLDSIIKRMRPNYMWWSRIMKWHAFTECTHVINMWTLMWVFVMKRGNLISFERSTRAPGALGMLPTGVSEVSFYSLYKAKCSKLSYLFTCVSLGYPAISCCQWERWVYISGNICSYTFQVTNGVAKASHVPANP